MAELLSPEQRAEVLQVLHLHHHLLLLLQHTHLHLR